MWSSGYNVTFSVSFPEQLTFYSNHTGYRHRSKAERRLAESLEKFGGDIQKLKTRLRADEATRKSARDHESRRRRPHPRAAVVDASRQLQTRKAAVFERRVTR